MRNPKGGSNFHWVQIVFYRVYHFSLSAHCDMIWKVLGSTVSNMKINDSHHLSLLPLKIQIIIFFASESAKQTIDYNHNLGFYIGQPVGRECPSFDHQRIPVCITVILLMMNY